MHQADFVDMQVPLHDHDDPGIIDVDMQDDDMSNSRPADDLRPATPYKQRIVNAFAKRPPLSPMDGPSPRRPRPPVRPPRTPAPATLRDEDSDADEDDPLALPSQRMTDSRESPPARASSSRKTRSSRRTSASSRRGTLDEEFKRTFMTEQQDEEADLDSGVLVGVGTRSKTRGFLAHGGAGGPSVFMGAGYVQGAEEEPEVEQQDSDLANGDSEYHEETPSKPKKKTSKATRGRRKTKR